MGPLGIDETINEKPCHNCDGTGRYITEDGFRSELCLWCGDTGFISAIKALVYAENPISMMVPEKLRTKEFQEQVLADLTAEKRRRDSGK